MKLLEVIFRHESLNGISYNVDPIWPFRILKAVVTAVNEHDVLVGKIRPRYAVVMAQKCLLFKIRGL